MKRSVFYVDGFNVYHAIARHKTPYLKWMSYWKFASILIPRDEELGAVKIFTALADHLPNSKARHELLLKAWRAEGCECVLGKFKRKQVYCKVCEQTTQHYEEKESDVNIAIHLLNDARIGLMDVAYIVSNDSDLAPALKMCKQEFPGIELVAVSPPGQEISKANKAAGHRAITTKISHVESCLLGQNVLDATGAVVAIRPDPYAPPVPLD